MNQPLPEHVSEILCRDLRSVAEEVEATPEQDLWSVPAGVINPVGTLAFHVCGNLRHFVGALLGGDGYVRDREAEFTPGQVTKEALLAELSAAGAAVSAGLEGLSPERLAEPMPGAPAQHQGKSVEFFLIQLCCHLAWHRGQLNYVRRILEAGAARS
jgi:hypothetical protein